MTTSEDKLTKYEDWWTKHSIGTRISLVVFLLVYAFAVYGNSSDTIIQITATTTVIAFMTVTLGNNMLVELAKLYFNKDKK